MEADHVEIKQMPSREMLEAFVTQMVMGTTVEVYFDSEQGIFIKHGEV